MRLLVDNPPVGTAVDRQRLRRDDGDSAEEVRPIPSKGWADMIRKEVLMAAESSAEYYL